MKGKLLFIGLALVALSGIMIAGVSASETDLTEEVNISDGDELHIDMNLTEDASEGDTVDVTVTDAEGVETYTETIELTTDHVEDDFVSDNVTANVTEETVLSSEDADPVTVEVTSDPTGLVDDLSVEVSDDVLISLPDADDLTDDAVMIVGAVVVIALIAGLLLRNE